MDKKQKVIPIGSDHGGFEMKLFLIEKLSNEGFEFKDYGTFSEDSVDYPDFIHPVAKAVNDGEYKKGIVICGSGQGANMTANKYSKIRSALCWNLEQTELTRLHNDANIMAIPGRFIEFGLAMEMVKKFFSVDFEGGRHNNRIVKIPLTNN
ncbi:MAG: ribose 5-phosphate isomerase B [Bacteroidetes bacterium]|nr:MAG: ribose 5-phosphate isomerase B [Bacteroidota bacterium]